MAKASSWSVWTCTREDVLAVTWTPRPGELQLVAMTGETAGWLGSARGCRGPSRVAYEAGPTGYGLARELARRGDRVCGRGAEEDPARGAGQGQDRPA